MKYQILIRPETESDLREAYRWYEKQTRGLGSSFLLAVEAGLASIQRHPEHYPQIFKKTRRALLRRFPYGIHYLVHESTISILAVFHAKRNPEVWKHRR